MAMSFSEFFARVREAAGGAYCTAQVQATDAGPHGGPAPELDWAAYVSIATQDRPKRVKRDGWTRGSHRTAESCLVELHEMLGIASPADVSTVDPMPEIDQ